MGPLRVPVRARTDERRRQSPDQAKKFVETGAQIRRLGSVKVRPTGVAKGVDQRGHHSKHRRGHQGSGPIRAMLHGVEIGLKYTERKRS